MKSCPVGECAWVGEDNSLWNVVLHHRAYQHLEECVMSRCEAHIVQVIVLATSTQATLTRGGCGVWRLPTKKDLNLPPRCV